MAKYFDVKYFDVKIVVWEGRVKWPKPLPEGFLGLPLAYSACEADKSRLRNRPMKVPSGTT
ncbi:hypothetical protein CEY04_15840 [Achromobacter sp. HZ28]|nr:hypothetical protein CEY04_15840 [Achromobacter sp. HZ28]OWT78302.1 hypothetical protein CEY05_10335 [Achromobacter sp. HZ34]